MQVADWLVRVGARGDVSVRDENGRTPMHAACREVSDLELEALLSLIGLIRNRLACLMMRAYLFGCLISPVVLHPFLVIEFPLALLLHVSGQACCCEVAV